MTDARPHYLFLTTSTREPGIVGNTEWLARQAAAALPPGATQTWLSLARMDLPRFVDQRHTTGHYPAPEGDMQTLLDATLAADHIVFVAPVYWFSGQGRPPGRRAAGHRRAAGSSYIFNSLRRLP